MLICGNFMHRDSHYRRLLVLPLLGSAFLLIPHIVVACVRAPKPTLLQAFEDAPFVLIARTISVEKTSDESKKTTIETFVTAATLEVTRVFKGNLRAGDKIVFGQGNGIRCTWVFREQDVGKEYMFYLHPPPEDEKLWYEYGMSRSHAPDMQLMIFFISTT